MKRTLTLILSLISLIAGAQEPQIIGGYLLDGQDSFEEPEVSPFKMQIQHRHVSHRQKDVEPYWRNASNNAV